MSAAMVATATATATDTPTPTLTPVATATDMDTATPEDAATATASPAPTDTPAPTSTPTASPTPPPTATPIPTPCPPDSACAPTPVPASVALADTENILLIGTDLRPTEGKSWRADTLMLVVIDWKNDRVGVISFPRDLMVNIPGIGYTRINRADYEGERSKHPDGGFGLLRDTFALNFGIRVDHFARLHREGFVRVIDALGGLDITLDCDLWELSPLTDNLEDGYKVLYIPAGPRRMDGVTALEFATFRYRSNDFDRARRQQVVLLALRNQLVSTDILRNLPEIWSALRENFITDLNLIDLMRFAALGVRIDLNEVHARVLGYGELQPANLPSGAAMLAPKESGEMFAAIENLFVAPPIFSQAERPQGCPPPPSWAADYGTPTPTPPPAGE